MRKILLMLIILSVYAPFALADCWGINTKILILPTLESAQQAAAGAGYFEVNQLWSGSVLLLRWDKYCK